MNLRIEIPGPVRGKGRHRTARAGNFVRQYADPKTANYENLIKVYAKEAMKAANLPLFVGPLQIEMLAVFTPAASWSKKKRAAALEGAIRPTGKPDWDNIGKIADALNGIVFLDDAQIVAGTVHKLYGDEPKLIIRVDQEI